MRIRSKPLRLHRLERIFDHVVKGLLQLVPIDLDQWKISAQLLLDENVAILDFRLEKTDRFLDEGVDIFQVRFEMRRADRAEETLNDRVGRWISSRATSRASCNSRRVVSGSLRSLRSINWRWMCSELSGLPISCATPAARRVSAVSRSLWMVSSVERRVSVMSRRMTAYPTASVSRVAAPLRAGASRLSGTT